MPGGRPRKPSRLRILEGGRGKSRPLTKDLQAPASPLVPPRGLSSAERAAWAHHVRDVRKMGIESSVDHGQFLAMIRFYCRAQAADRVISRRGLTTSTKANGEVQRPEVAISERSWKFYAQLADKFGMSELARTKLGTDQKKPESASDLPADLRDASSS